MFVRFLFIFDKSFIVLKIALWPSAGKELSSWLAVRNVFILCLLNRAPVPFSVRAMMWNSIVHCPFIYIADTRDFFKCHNCSLFDLSLFSFTGRGYHAKYNCHASCSTSCSSDTSDICYRLLATYIVIGLVLIGCRESMSLRDVTLSDIVIFGSGIGDFYRDFSRDIY